MLPTAYIACDLGAGSGRVILGHLKDNRLTLDDIHRFVSPPIRIRSTLRWNVLQIYEDLKVGLHKATQGDQSVASLSVDSWGDDYAREIEAKYGVGIGVAGTGLSGCGPALGLQTNITDRVSIRAMLD